jgi:hypothetical protein
MGDKFDAIDKTEKIIGHFNLSFFLHGSTALDLLLVGVPRSHPDTPQSVGLPWTSDLLDAEP